MAREIGDWETHNQVSARQALAAAHEGCRTVIARNRVTIAAQRAEQYGSSFGRNEVAHALLLKFRELHEQSGPAEKLALDRVIAITGFYDGTS